MKKFWLFLLIFYFLSLIFNLSYAHPPWNIEMELEGKELKAIVYHDVSGTQHYIYKVEIYVNGTKHITQEFFTQVDDVQIIHAYIPSLEKGDLIELKAFCNQGGDLVSELTVK